MRGQYYTQQPLSRNAGGLLFWLGELTIPKECYSKFYWWASVGFLQNVKQSADLNLRRLMVVCQLRYEAAHYDCSTEDVVSV